MGLTIGVDVGGTKVLAGVVDEAGNVLDQARDTTPKTDPAAIAEVIGSLVSGLRERHDVVMEHHELVTTRDERRILAEGPQPLELHRPDRAVVPEEAPLRPRARVEPDERDALVGQDALPRAARLELEADRRGDGSEAGAPGDGGERLPGLQRTGGDRRHRGNR